MIYIKLYEHWMSQGKDKFKIGDIITCLRDNSFTYLKNGNSYIVTEVMGDLIEVTNYNKSFYEVLNRTRFRLATPEEIQKFNYKKDINKYNL